MGEIVVSLDFNWRDPRKESEDYSKTISDLAHQYAWTWQETDRLFQVYVRINRQPQKTWRNYIQPYQQFVTGLRDPDKVLT